MFSAIESFLFIPSSGFLCFCHRLCLRNWKPQKVLISKLFEVLRLYLILSTFLSILCVQGTTIVKQCSKILTKTLHWSLKVVLLFLEARLLLRYEIGIFSSFLVMVTINNECFLIRKLSVDFRHFLVFIFCHRGYLKTWNPWKIFISSFFEVLSLFIWFRALS